MTIIVYGHKRECPLKKNEEDNLLEHFPINFYPVPAPILIPLHILVNSKIISQRYIASFFFFFNLGELLLTKLSNLLKLIELMRDEAKILRQTCLAPFLSCSNQF